MKVYLDAGAVRFGKLLDRFEKLNIRGCRAGHGSMEDYKSTIKELASWKARRPKSSHIYIVHGVEAKQIIDKAEELAAWASQHAVAEGVILEIGNEVNLSSSWENRPEEMGEITNKVWLRVEHLGVKVISPSVSNIGRTEFEYARRMLSKIPDQIPFAFHRYKVPDLTQPRSQYGSRQDEIDALLEVAGGREVWLTETGQSEVYFRYKPFPLCWQKERRELSEDEVTRQCVEELRFWQENGLIEAIVFYQLNDGPDPNNPQHHFGWRHYGDTYLDEWKVISQVMPAEIAKVDPGTIPDVHPSRQAQAKARWLHEPEKPKRNIIPLGNSLFYALGQGMPREQYSQVIDNFAGIIDEARFNMSTLGWGDEGPETQTAPPVIPFLKGSDPGFWGYSRRINPAFLDEMEWRLDYAVNRGVRPQLTVFWGGFQEMFIKSVNEPANNHNVEFHEEAMEDYLGAICERLEDHPAVNVELFNEINHGAHLWMLGRKGRREFIKKWGRFIKDRLPDHLLTVSGENVDNDGKEGGYHFAYHDITELDYWNVHFDRSKKPAVEGFEPWVRSVWHLNEEAHRFRAQNPGQGYGRNDEPMFLQTQKQHQEWPYRWSTLDWKMYGVSIFVAFCAGVATTIHNQGGFFHGYRKKKKPDPDFPLTEPIYGVARFYQKILDGFNLAGCTPYNSGWNDSPVRDMGNSFKAFSLVGKDKESILITVLNPSGQLKLDLDSAYTAVVYEITGEEVYRDQLPAGPSSMPLPRMPKFENCAVIRLDRWKP